MKLTNNTSLNEFRRPEKILWEFPQVDPSKLWTDNIQSKSLQKLAKNSDSLLSTHNISYTILPLTEQKYLEWHEYYSKTMIELGHDIIASPDWFEQRHSDFKNVWIMEFRTDQLVGASIISENLETVWTHHFKASARLDLGNQQNSSLGTVIEFIYLQFAFEQKAKVVTSGLSRNGFGYFNSLGYFVSKLRIGYVPTASAKHVFDQEFLIKDDETPTLWLVIDTHEKLQLLAFPNANSLADEVKTYIDRVNIPIINYFSY